MLDILVDAGFERLDLCVKLCYLGFKLSLEKLILFLGRLQNFGVSKFSLLAGDFENLGPSVNYATDSGD
jgi:hypothetical protein